MKNKKRKLSVFYRIFMPMLAIVLLQIIILYGVLRFYGIFSSLNQNSLRLLQERTQNKQQTLLANMINDWSNLSSIDDNINSLIEEELESEGKSWDAIKSDPELNQKLVEKTTGVLIQKLRNSKTTGIFMILDGIAVEDKTDSYAGVYFRDSDPYENLQNNSDLLMVRGLPPLSRKFGITLDSYWKASFTFKGEEDDVNNRFFFRPLREAEKGETTEAKYLGYWSPTFSFEKGGEVNIITYSIPLINKEGLVYGVVGVEISQSHLISQISNEGYGNRENCFYYLGVTKDNRKTFEPIAVAGNRYNLGEFTTEKEEEKGFVLTESRQGAKLHGAVFDLKLYNNNTPFMKEQWVLIGMQDDTTLFSFTKQTQRLIFLSMAISLLAGCFVAGMTSKSTSHPITRLVEGVNSSMQDELELPYSGIREIDDLADAIKTRNKNIIDSSKRTSQLIELSGLPVGVYEIRNDMNYVYCSKGFFSILRMDRQESRIERKELDDIIREATKYPLEDGTYAIYDQNENYYLRFVKQTNENGIIGAVLDVTEEILNRKKIERERDYDALTGIWNRRAFEFEMKYLFKMKKDELKIGALVMFDMDNLKFLNDAYGHDCGDEYIRAFAHALDSFENDNMIVARRSGDEFYAFIYGYPSKKAIYEEIKKCWEYVSSKKIILPDSTEYRLRVSGGIAWYPDDAHTPEKLIHYADFAMYQVKHTQKGSIYEFDKMKYTSESFLFRGQDAFNRLIDHQLIRFVFQPIFEAATGNIFGYELLMRSEVEELRTPDIILRMAKSQGKLHHIENLTWKKSLEDAKRLTEKGIIDKDSKLFINSIANQTLFRSEEQFIEEKYSDLLSRVVLEVTESEDNNIDYTKRKLAFIHAHNGLIAIDDFGTGYNSELALVMIPANIVKIDISLVRNVDKDVDKQVLIKNLISYARQRNISVLAEGVERKEELKVLVEYGCDLLQGFYLSKPDYEPKPLDDEKKKELVQLQNLKNKKES